MLLIEKKSQSKFLRSSYHLRDSKNRMAGLMTDSDATNNSRIFHLCHRRIRFRAILFFVWIVVGSRRDCVLESSDPEAKAGLNWVSGITFSRKVRDLRLIVCGVAIILLIPIIYWGVRLWEDWYCRTFAAPCLTTASFGAVLLFGILGVLALLAGLGARWSPPKPK